MISPAQVIEDCSEPSGLLDPELVSQRWSELRADLKPPRIPAARAALSRLRRNPGDLGPDFSQLLRALAPQLRGLDRPRPIPVPAWSTRICPLLHKSTPSLVALTGRPDQPLRLKDHELRLRSSPRGRLERLLLELRPATGVLTNARSILLLAQPDESAVLGLNFATDDLVESPESLTVLSTLLQLAVTPSPVADHRLDQLLRDSRDHRDTTRLALEQNVVAAFSDLAAALPKRLQAREVSLDEARHSISVAIMRLVVLLFLEDRALLPTDTWLYLQSYAIQTLATDLRERRRHDPESLHRRSSAWLRILACVGLVHEGCHHPDLNLIPYGGALFDRSRSPLLEAWRPDDAVVQRTLERLTRLQDTHGPRAVSYGALDVEQLGDLYETLLGLELIADGEDRRVVASARRRRSGTFYTPRSHTEAMVKTTLEPAIARFGDSPEPRHILGLRVLDPTVGSGAFLVAAARELAARLVAAWERRAMKAGPDALLATPYAEPAADPERDHLLPLDDPAELRVLATRLVVERCLYGVDINPDAIEIARLSLWLVSIARDRPFTFVDHALKVGNALLGQSVEALTAARPRDQAEPLSLFSGLLQRRVNKALAKRRELIDIDGRNPARRRLKRSALSHADHALDPLRTLGDLLTLRELDRQDASDVIIEACHDLTGLHDNVGAADRRRLHELRPFHWELEFPEVFLDEDRAPGFDVIVANPPFQGGGRITAATGRAVARRLRDRLPGRGPVDLCIHVLHAAWRCLRPDGHLGFLLTNSATEGRSRRLGLDHLLSLGGTILHARSAEPWPGSASLNVVRVHLANGPTATTPILDGRPVRTITGRLDSLDIPEPQRIPGRAKESFQGSIPGDKGFLLTPVEAMELCREHPEWHSIIRPYLTGADLNHAPYAAATRWILDPSRLTKADLEASPELSKELADRLGVRVQRRQRWWQHTEHRPGLYQQARRHERVLVRSRLSSRHIVHVAPAECVFGDGLVVFPTDDLARLALLQSRTHEAWFRVFASTLRQDLRYGTATCFETFPFPTLSDNTRRELERLGARLIELRERILDAEGVTLARIHDASLSQSDQSLPSLGRIRELSLELERSVLEAYGFADLDPDALVHQSLDLNHLRSIGSKAGDNLESLLGRLAALNQFQARSLVEQEES